jgi:hypothetical protein
MLPNNHFLHGAFLLVKHNNLPHDHFPLQHLESNGRSLGLRIDRKESLSGQTLITALKTAGDFVYPMAVSAAHGWANVDRSFSTSA